MGHLATPGDILVITTKGCYQHLAVQAGDAAKHPAMWGMTALKTKNYPAWKWVEVGKTYLKTKSHVPILICCISSRTWYCLISSYSTFRGVGGSILLTEFNSYNWALDDKELGEKICFGSLSYFLSILGFPLIGVQMVTKQKTVEVWLYCPKPDTYFLNPISSTLKCSKIIKFPRSNLNLFL